MPFSQKASKRSTTYRLTHAAASIGLIAIGASLIPGPSCCRPRRCRQAPMPLVA